MIEKVHVSALQHYSYCPRQCALIHLEQTFDENIYTLRGRRVHEKVDEPGQRWDGGIVVETALPIWSNVLGLIGIADVVEFSGEDLEIVRPVEYKHGRRKDRLEDNIQLCAQALCLEEMLGVEIKEGDIFHFSSRRRRNVIFDLKLRSEVEETIVEVRTLLQQTKLPKPVNDARCRNCSLADACMPAIS